MFISDNMNQHQHKSLQFGQKSAIVYMLFVPNFKIILLTGFAFQLGTEERVVEDFD